MDGARGQSARRLGDQFLTPTASDQTDSSAPDSVAQVHLIVGNLTLAEPKARKMAERLARDDPYTLARHKESLAGVLDDLETFSLFGEAKVVIAFETALLADQSAASSLVDAALDDPVSDPSANLSGRQRWCATRLYSVLNMFGLDPFAGSAEEAVADLPDHVLKGASGRIGAARVSERREQLVRLLQAGREQEVAVHSEAVVERIAAALEHGFPPGHHLILVESAVDESHPLASRLKALDAVVGVGEITAQRQGGWQGADRLAAALAAETGIKAAPAAIRELAERTLRRKARDRSGVVDADSAARFAAEYRKLATYVDAEITVQDVRRVVADRGDQDVFQIMDAIGEGKTGEVLHRFTRYMDAASDPEAARLGFFSQLAEFCRHLAWIEARFEQTGVERGMNNYPQFKQRLAPILAADTGVDALHKIHPFRLHRAYLAASRLRPGRGAELPAKVLVTERRIKGESRSADLAIDALLADLCATLA